MPLWFNRQVARFLCDAMLGSLARWLRLAGYDCEYSGAEDRELAARAEREGRWLLTRDRELAAVGPRSLLVRQEGVEAQLVEVLGRLGLAPSGRLEDARCAACNGGLREASPAEVEGLVPPYVRDTAPRFRACSGCGRVYWPGTHSARIRDRLERVRSAVVG